MTRAVVVTGAARGIGRAISERLVADGHKVVAVDLAPDLDIQGAIPVQVDLTTSEGISAVAESVSSSGFEDIRLVNMTDEDFAAVLDVNLGAALNLSTELSPLIVEGGAIVNIASRAYLGNFGQFNYSMSKGGVVGMTRAMALSLAPRVRVNAIAPGLIGTEMAMAIPDDVLGKMVDAIPLQRMGEPSEVADVVAYLLGSESSYITGEVVVVGGGRSLS